MRDPLLYRIRHAEHHHTGGKWCIYPMYDFAHCLSDYIEGITHSICTLEFEVHRPLYDWILESLDLPRPLPHQYEFARLSLGYTVMSKRKLLQLVNEKLVTGWDDPRMPTICGIRRRGVTREALCAHFAYNIGITKYNGITDVAVLEHAIREDLNKRALRRLAVLRPIKVVITNYPEGKIEELDAVNNPEDETAGKRKIPFSRELFIEQRRFQGSAAAEIFPAQTRRRSPAEIRLHHQVRRSGEGRRRQHHRTALHRRPRQQDRRRRRRAARSRARSIGSAPRTPWTPKCAFTTASSPWPSRTRTGAISNPCSTRTRLEVVTAKCEPSLKDAKPELRYQFERLAYFALGQGQRPRQARLQPHHHAERHLGEGSAKGINLFMKTKIIYLLLPLVLLSCSKKPSEAERRANIQPSATLPFQIIVVESPETKEMNTIMQQAATLLESKDFDKLDDAAAKYRVSKECYADCSQKLALIYDGLEPSDEASDAVWEARLQEIRNWIAAKLGIGDSTDCIG